MTRPRALLAAAAALLAPSAAMADHPFILSSSTLLSGEGNTVTFDAAGSDHVFFFDHRPLAPETIVVVRPDGTSGPPIDATRTRFRTVFDLRLDQQGTWKVASDQTGITGSFRLNGEERRVGGRGGPPRGERGGPPGAGAPPAADAAPRRTPPVAVDDIPVGATDVHLTENDNRAETFVTAGAPTEAALTPRGKGLELAPITHPNSLVVGETARFRLLVDGRPAPVVKVTVVPGGDRYREDAGEMHLVTDPDGVVTVLWPVAGMYWLGAEAEDGHPADRRAERRRLAYAATLEVMTP